MRIFQKRGWYHVEIDRNHSRALGTRDPAEAARIVDEIIKAEARQKVSEIESASRIKLKNFAEKYIEYREGLKDLSEETIKKDKLSLKLLAGAIGDDTLMAAIVRKKSKKLEDFKKIALAAGASPITINGYLRHLKTAFKWGKEDEDLIDRLPKIVMYKRIKKDEEAMLDRILMPEEIKKALAKADEFNPKFGLYVLTLLWTGGRRREALGLEYQRMDFTHNLITLIGKTGKRIIPMLAPVKEAHKPFKKDIGRVFPDWHPDTVSHWLKKVLRDCGIEDHRLHDLRHTCATYLLKNGVELAVVQRIMGHAQMSTTQIYAKVLPDIMASQMEKLNFD